MKKIILTLPLIFGISNAIEISKSKSFNLNIPPQNMNANFSLQYKAKKSEEIEKLFKQAIDIVKSEQICKGGKYSIYPNYYYNNNKRVADGYRSSINFDCKFEDTKKYETLLSKVKKLNAPLRQGRINYSTTKETKDKYLLRLEEQSFLYAKQYAEFLNQQFAKCKVKSINLNGENYYQPVYREMALAKSDTQVSAPIKEDIKVSINVNYTFECRTKKGATLELPPIVNSLKQP